MITAFIGFLLLYFCIAFISGGIITTVTDTRYFPFMENKKKWWLFDLTNKEEFKLLNALAHLCWPIVFAYYAGGGIIKRVKLLFSILKRIVHRVSSPKETLKEKLSPKEILGEDYIDPEEVIKQALSPHNENEDDYNYHRSQISS